MPTVILPMTKKTAMKEGHDKSSGFCVAPTQFCEKSLLQLNRRGCHRRKYENRRSWFSMSREDIPLPSQTSTAPVRSAYSESKYAACIPQAAELIEDEAAINMLSRVQYTPVTTRLSPSVIHTSHVVSKGNNVCQPLLLFLHGFDSNLLEYRYMMPYLDADSTESHFVDILGWGFTERPDQPDFSYGTEAKRLHLEGYLDRFASNRPVVLIGASIGGAVAIDYLLHSQRRVDALVLLDAQAFTDKRKSRLGDIRRIAELGADVLRSRWLRKMATDISYYSKSFKCEDTLRIGGLHCFSPRWKESAVDFIRGEGYCLRDKISNIDVPTLVLWGQNDRVLPKGDARKFQNTIRNCRLEYITECGHSPHIEKPLFVSDAVLNFVKHLSLTP